MKRISAIMAAMAITGTALTSCSESNATQDGESAIIGKNEIKIEGGLMTPEALWAMGRIGEVSVSPDGKSIVYGVSYYSVEKNKSHHTLHIMNADGSGKNTMRMNFSFMTPERITEGVKLLASLLRETLTVGVH